MSRLVLICTAAILASPLLAVSQSRFPDGLSHRVDAVFAKYFQPGSPGCSVGVYNRGTVKYAHGYGLASLEYGVPNSASTPFSVGSLAKQFTAAAIALLIERGQLKLTDKVRTYVPELPNYGSGITIAHLLQHTSGVRDFWALLEFAGSRADDGYNINDVLTLLARQQRTNFTPGTRFAYSNSGYALLGLVVQRVSGMSLRVFADTEIFAPLGMMATHFNDDHRTVVRGRATAYSPGPNQTWSIDIRNSDIVGEAGLITTVYDLARWDDNFLTGRVGGDWLLARQKERGVLADGSLTLYTYGLFLGTYRGQSTMEHSGNEGGYRSAFIRFPETDYSVAVLCNAGDADPAELAHRVADIVLAPQLGLTPVLAETPSPEPPKPQKLLHGVELSVLQGRYYCDELGVTYEIAMVNGTLVVRRPYRPEGALRQVGDRSFQVRAITIVFLPDASGFAASGGGVQGLKFERIGSPSP